MTFQKALTVGAAMRSVDIDLLQTLVAFADTGSCRAAAKVINRTQAAVSVHLKRLEDTVRAPLVIRKGRHLVLTDQGVDLVRDARRALQVNREIIERFSTSEIQGTVRIGLPDDYLSILSCILLPLSMAYPRVNFEISCAPSAELRPMLRAGDLDISILSAETDSREGYVLRTEPVLWTTSKRHEAHRLTTLPLAFFPEGCIFRKWALNVLANVERDFRIACTSRNMSALHAVVQSGLAVSAFIESDIPAGCRPLLARDGFPPLPDVTIILALARTLRVDLRKSLANMVPELIAWSQLPIPKSGS
jgi:DNA-binding transcriptional LysR family regulator